MWLFFPTNRSPLLPWELTHWRHLRCLESYKAAKLPSKRSEMHANLIAQECICWSLKARLLHWFPLLDWGHTDLEIDENNMGKPFHLRACSSNGKSSLHLECIYSVINMPNVPWVCFPRAKYCKLKTVQLRLKVQNKSVPLGYCAREWEGMCVDHGENSRAVG
jgi:hypothetical protein